MFISTWFKSIFWATYIAYLKFEGSNAEVCPFSKQMNYCLSSKLENVAFCTIEKVEANNQKPYFILEKLLHEPFFRYFKVNDNSDQNIKSIFLAG